MSELIVNQALKTVIEHTIIKELENKIKKLENEVKKYKNKTRRFEAYCEYVDTNYNGHYRFEYKTCVMCDNICIHHDLCDHNCDRHDEYPEAFRCRNCQKFVCDGCYINIIDTPYMCSRDCLNELHKK